MTVVHKHKGAASPVRARVTDAEWQMRVDLAACYRLVAHNGWTDLVFTHISARVPGNEEHFLLNPFGHLFDEVTASSLVKIDLDGNKVEDSPYDIHPAGFVIHSAVHAARPDVTCVIHTHTEAGMAISALECGLLPLTQHAQLFHGRVGYHDFEGLANDVDERQRLVADLGQHPVMILRNHGLLVTGETVPQAYSLMHHLEKACAAQLAAMATGAKLTLPPEPVSVKTAQQATAPTSPIGKREWPGLLRMLDRLDPSYRD
ncbi:MAG: class II aldolase/adducin family protein [Candidatus Eiseniibacteriota bacterium]